MFEDFVGVSSTPVANDVERGAIRRFAEAIEDPNPLYIDEEAAARGPHGALIAPPTFVRTLEYGEIEGLALPDSGLIHGDNLITFERPLFVGERVLCRREFTEYSERQTRTGRLGFLVLAGYGDAPDGERVFETRDTVILTPALLAAVEGAR